MKNIKYFVGAICLALSLNSCSDFLNEEPLLCKALHNLGYDKSCIM